jgi:hypothetical protein
MAAGDLRRRTRVSNGVGLEREVAAMAGKFLRRGAIVDTKKSEERMNALQARSGRARYHVRVTSCGCPDPNCGAFHALEATRPLPDSTEAVATLKRSNAQRKLAKRANGQTSRSTRSRAKTRAPG